MSVNKPGSAEWLQHQAGEPENCPSDQPSLDFMVKVEELYNSLDNVTNDDEYSDFMDVDLKAVMIHLEDFFNKYE